MNRGESKKSSWQIWGALVALIAFGALPAQAQNDGKMKEKRFLVRYDHGSANLAPWAGLALYVSSERVKVLAGNEMVHDIRVEDITGFTHELRAPFDPAKTMEKVSNDTIGACSNVADCAVLGPAGAVGLAGVGIATLFTPKETVITLNWNESGQPRQLAMKIAWYQRDFILRALERATGLRASERTAGRPNAHPAQPAPVRQGAQAPQATALASPSRARVEAAPQATPAAASQPAEAQINLIRRFELVLDRAARVGATQVQPGFYLVLVQERASGKALLVFLDDSVKDAQTPKIVARATADVTTASDDQALQPVFAEDAGGVLLNEIRLPGRTLRLTL